MSIWQPSGSQPTVLYSQLNFYKQPEDNMNIQVRRNTTDILPIFHKRKIKLELMNKKLICCSYSDDVLVYIQRQTHFLSPLVHWSIGSMVHWSFVPLIHSSILVHWSIGPLVHKTIGPLVPWSIGLLVEVKCQN